MKNKKALVLGGKTGLLGQDLVLALKQAGWEVIAPGRGELDLFSGSLLTDFIKNQGFDCIFNTIAYTQVEQAEEDLKQARELNQVFPALLGRVCAKLKVYLIHYSTDFVFDGQKKIPYEPEDSPNPLNVYGQTKLAGENALLAIDDLSCLIIRTAWLFGKGKPNFVSKILALAEKKKSLNVVCDQVGSPTYTWDLARYSLALVEKGAKGVFHVVNAGQASWCELAQEAVRCLGLHCKIVPISSQEYPQKAKRPGYSVLSVYKFVQVTQQKPRSWVQALREYVYESYLE